MRLPGHLSWGLLAGLAGCAVGPNYQAPAPDAPAAFIAAAPSPAAPGPGDSQAPDPAAWWHALHDEALDELVERAVRANPDLQIALDRLQQARTFETVVLGHALPEIDAGAAAGRGTGSDLTRGRAPQTLVSADNSSGLKHINTLAGFDAVWEIDVFGKARREIQAAHAGTQAAAALRNGVLTSVVADVVRSYIDLRGLQTQRAILQQAQLALGESLRIVTIRYERGITNELDVTLATRELAALEAQIAPVEAQARAAQAALATLLGEYPESLAAELDKPGPIPEMPTAVQPGTPLQVLRRRPDVLQAERELAAATARIGVATANLFPQLALSGAVGAQGQDFGTTPATNRHLWSFGAGAIWPLLDFGALDAEVAIADLDAHASLVNYRRTIIQAVQDVDTALSAYAAQEDRLARLGTGLVAAERAVALATARYDRGLTEYLDVVDAQRQLYDLQDQYVLTQMAAAEQFVKLFKGLGGGWQNYQDIAPIHRPEPAVIAMFQRLLGSAVR